MRRGRQPSAESITSNIQTSCDLQIRSRTVLRELRGMGFQGQAAASKSYIVKHNAMRQMQWCKARHHCTLKVTNQACLSGNLIEESGFGSCQETCLTLVVTCGAFGR